MSDPDDNANVSRRRLLQTTSGILASTGVTGLGAASTGRVATGTSPSTGRTAGFASDDGELTLEECVQTDGIDRYGPTAVNAALGNQGLSVGINDEGTITLFRWPRPSYYDHVKYLTTDRSKEHMGADANAGAFLGLVLTVGGNEIGETGTVDLAADPGGGGDWLAVGLDGTYEEPVVVTSPLPHGEGEAGHPRIRNVGSDSFEIQIEEWGYQDDEHATLPVDYLVLEAGVHELPDGTRLDVGHVETDEAWAAVEFDGWFDRAPVVVTGTQTYNNKNLIGSHSEAVVTGQRNVTADGFETHVLEQESYGDHAKERIGYLAVAPGTGETEGVPFEAGTVSADERGTAVGFDQSFGSTPRLFAGTQTTSESDPVDLRRSGTDADGTSLSLREERSADDEIDHPTEEVGYLAIEGGPVVAEDRETVWLRDLAVEQTYPEPYSDTLVTRHRSDTYGLTVEVTDLVDHDQDVLVRDVEVALDADSPVEGAELVAFENFNLVASKWPLFPTKDWCNDPANKDAARYEPDPDAIVHYKESDDPVVVAMGFDGPSRQHHVGGDAFDGDDVLSVTVPILGTVSVEWGESNTGDALVDVSEGGIVTGNEKFSGHTTGVLTRDLTFSDGSASARLHFAAAESQDAAASLLASARSWSFAARRDDKRAWFENQVGDAPLPATDDEDVLALSRRALLTLVQNYDPDSGAIVASIGTQAPYSLDWIRDGAYFNFVLDRVLGKHDWVEKRNRWYASLQEGPNDHVHSDSIPDGNWAMDYYADGVAGGPIPWEIDETGYGIWTLVDHYAATGDEAYLQDVYPAIQRAADHLVSCRDSEGRQCKAHEDDHAQKSKTIVGGASAHAGLEAATRAARALGYDSDAETYDQRREELGAAIEEHYWDADAGTYGTSPRVVMPAFLRPFDDPRMADHLDSMWADLSETFEGNRDSGLYESKSLLGLAKAWKGDATAMEKVKDGLSWVASKHATSDTHLMGEVWLRHDGEVITSVSQPHTWEQVLFYLAALEAYPPSDAVQQRLAVGREKWRRFQPSVTSVSIPDGPYAAGDLVEVVVEVANEGTADGTFYVDLEVVDPDGYTREGDGTPLSIPQGGTETTTIQYGVPSDPTAGNYDVRVVVWKEESLQYLQTRLDTAMRTDAFVVE